jgi:acyl-CoA synthetase (AMP-forming)/AMP-acid ligase II
MRNTTSVKIGPSSRGRRRRESSFRKPVSDEIILNPSSPPGLNNLLTPAPSLIVQEKRISPYYFFERHAQQKPNAECLWWRAGSHTWGETYFRSNQYAQFFLSHGIKTGDLVALFMDNSPDFVFAWLGLFAIGAAPALINHNLTKAALLHCLGISRAPLVLVDGRPELIDRIHEVKDELAAQGVKVVNLADARGEINAMKGERPADKHRDNLPLNAPFGLFYTR